MKRLSRKELTVKCNLGPGDPYIFEVMGKQVFPIKDDNGEVYRPLLSQKEIKALDSDPAFDKLILVEQ
jgi:hypothetical protein